MPEPLGNPHATCPHCGRGATSFTGVTNASAQAVEGDFAICAYCRGLSVYRADLTLRVATDREAEEAHKALGHLVDRWKGEH